MSNGLLAIVIGIPVAWHLGVTALAYWDAGRVPMPRRKWTAIVFLVPLLGAFAYLMERSELSYDPDTDPYRRDTYNLHPTRADEARGLHPESGGDADRPSPEAVGDADGPGSGHGGSAADGDGSESGHGGSTSDADGSESGSAVR